MSTQLRRPLVLVAGALLLLLLGLIYAYSVLLAPLKVAFDWDVSGMTLIFALSIISFTVGCLVSGELERRGFDRPGLLLGAALLLAGFIGTSSAGGATSLLSTVAFYGVVSSLGIGVVYNIVIPTVTAWFPDRPGMAQGVALMGFGCGGFVLGPVMTQLYSMLDWRLVLVGTGVLFAAAVMLTALVVRPPTAREGAALSGLAPDSDRGGDGSAGGNRDAGLAEMLRDRSFYLLYAFLFFMGSVGMGVTGIGRELPLSLGADDMTAAFVIGFVNIGSGIGRLCGGAALDRLGRGPAMFAMAVLGVAGPLSLVASLLLTSLPLQTVACLVTGIGWGAAVVSMPFVTRTEWGQSNMAENMAVVNTYSIFGSVVGSWGSGLLSTMLGSFVPVLFAMCIMGLASVFVAVMLRAGAATNVSSRTRTGRTTVE
ncbi:MFS transporter [Olsenella sp. DSM 107455]|uniref:MFS transporter n=1 Tax=Thermophilibacter gallinarum TaxID=2779357 RepID=A0ABR9QT47_9ACTN|nr:MFS transporter [Thermophilibacter gallinarum]MBE5023897.1 MFS transporter [Thermophilibacter gallinarum]